MSSENKSHPIKIHGGHDCPLAFEIRDFLKRSAIDFEWHELRTKEDACKLPGIGDVDDALLPLVELTDGTQLYHPCVRDLAERFGFLAKPKFEKYDLTIYGAGPAGLSAAVYAASEGLKTALIERHALGGQAGTSSRIENYLGFPEGVSGAELADRARQQALKFGCEILQFREGVYAEFIDGEIHAHLTDGSKMISRANICATGVDYRRLDLPNERNFIGAGLFYGAGYSEAPLIVDETVYIVGGANSAGQAAMHFSLFAKKIVLLVRSGKLTTMSEYLTKRVLSKPNIEVRFLTAVVGLDGVDCLAEITLRHLKDGTEETVPCKHLFVAIGGSPHTEWARNTPIIRDDKKYIVTGTDMYVDGRPPAIWTLERPPYFLETSVPGCFAAGDVRHNSVKRYATAVGEGAMAVTFVHRFLAGIDA
ncbi:MAG: NAD(P)/FAD-dependent oxidoreductase [Chthoniobacterales bacterium]